MKQPNSPTSIAAASSNRALIAQQNNLLLLLLWLWRRRRWRQELESQAITRQCIFPLAYSTAIAAGESRLGAPCASDSDCPSNSAFANAAKTSVTARGGRCTAASRAYCPDQCTYTTYLADRVLFSPLSNAAVSRPRLPILQPVLLCSCLP
jgi:hypothetical protein